MNCRTTSVLIWRIYIEFEARYGEPQRAKELIFRGMRECPWSKGKHIGWSLLSNTRFGYDGVWNVEGII
jgi:hypothetical protein